MKKAFLKEVAEDLFGSWKTELEELCLVFPNRRAGLFFKKYLAESLEHPVWSPAVYTIQELMSGESELEYADELELISSLYGVYTGIRGVQESFDDFFYWAGIMLADFDEIDKYLIDPRDLFRNISELREIETAFDYLTDEQIALIQRFWKSFRNDRISEQKQQFLDIWNLLLPVYTALRETLVKSGAGYEGMIYRNVAEKIRENRMSGPSFKKLVFIGFNALNPCEQELFRFYNSRGKAIFYWDYDEYYLGNEQHEAGRFIRQNLSLFPDHAEKFNRNNLVNPGKTTVYSVPSDAGQAQIVHKILEEAGKQSEIGEETAIVLADEELLIPVLHALPERLSEINITMGYPVTATPVFSLVEHLISLQQNIRSGPDEGYYHLNVLPLLQHQYISLNQKEEAFDLVKKINEGNLIYVPEDMLRGSKLFEAIFRRIENPSDIAAYLIEILEILAGTGEEQEHPVPALELEFIYRIYTRINRLKDELMRLNMDFSPSTFLKLFHLFLQKTRIPFSGEPLAGLQVMGVLETRVLDFDRVILLSMNEGAFPKSSHPNSFIPHNLRFGFQLPTLEYRDAIYAFYFYRLIQRAAEVHLIYNNKSDGLTTGEKSRYIHQLKFDPRFGINEISVGFDVLSGRVLPIEITKSGAIMDQLNRFSADGGDKYLSPSALNSYIECSLRFYFKYVAEIYEPDELMEDIDPAMFGTILHESVHNLYRGLKNPVQRKDLGILLSDRETIGKMVDRAFRKAWLKDPSARPEGRNLVIREIIISYVDGILQKDMEYCPIHIESLEEKYMLQIPVRTGTSGINILIGGKIDRVDRITTFAVPEPGTGPGPGTGTETGAGPGPGPQSFRVIDYKTGKGDMQFGSLGELFERNTSKRNAAAFQTMMYARLYSGKGELQNRPLIPGLYLLRDIFDPGFRFHFSTGQSRKKEPVLDYSHLDEEFSRHLSAILESLFDSRESFSQTDDRKSCQYCTFKGICRR